MIVLKTESEVARMREAGKILAGVLSELARLVRPGIGTPGMGLWLG